MIKIGDKVKYLGVYDAIVRDIFYAKDNHEVIDLYKIEINGFNQYVRMVYPNDIKEIEKDASKH